MKILFIGDIFAKTGIRAVQEQLPLIKANNKIDFVIANAENATNCRGLSLQDYETLSAAGIDFFTMGNHTWNNFDYKILLSEKNNIVRPANIKADEPYALYGVGSKTVVINGITMRITNLLSESVWLNKISKTNAFLALDEIIANNDAVDFHFVDFHSETTAEKNAFFYDFQGKVQAIVGTHTHVQTADNRIRNNTAFISDVGSTGPADGVIGANGKFIVERFRKLTEKFWIEEQGGKYQFSAVIIDFDEASKQVKSIERVLIYE